MPDYSLSAGSDGDGGAPCPARTLSRMTDAASSDHAADRPDTAPYPNSASVPAGAAERSAPGLRSVGRVRTRHLQEAKETGERFTMQIGRAHV